MAEGVCLNPPDAAVAAWAGCPPTLDADAPSYPQQQVDEALQPLLVADALKPPPLEHAAQVNRQNLRTPSGIGAWHSNVHFEATCEIEKRRDFDAAEWYTDSVILK